MSQVYSTEPQTSGSVVFETTAGPLSIHLWCKECPHTVRYFLQLCIDGFYDNLVFHRIVPGFLVQTGDAAFRQGAGSNDDGNEGENPRKQPPSKTYRRQHGAGTALDRRKYELNSRIRFNHRGQIAMALGIDDDNENDDENDKDEGSLAAARLQPQFFITLDEASHLDGKHVCFGGITGPTVFNALRIGGADVYHNEADEADPKNFRPRILSEAPRILRTRILSADLPPTLPALAPTQDRSMVPWAFDPLGTAFAPPKPKRKKKNRKGVKNTNLLSFGEEMIGDDGDGDGDGGAKGKKKKMLSSHDVLASKSLSSERSIPSEPSPKERESASSGNKDPEDAAASDPHKDTPLGGAASASANHSQTPAPTPTPATDTGTAATDSGRGAGPPLHPTFSSRADRETAASAERHPVSGASDRGAKPEKKKDNPKKTSLVEARRARYASKNSRKKGSSKQQREEETMARFKAFQQKITTHQKESGIGDGASGATAATYHGQILETDDATGGSDWIRTRFKCKKHMDQDARGMGGADGRGIDDYVVIEERGSATDRKPGKRKRHRHG